MRGTRAFVVVGVLALLLAACGSPDPTPTPPSGPGGEEPLTGFEAEWAALIEAAQEEGRLIVSGSGGVAEIAPVYRIWGEKFGIRVTIARGSGSENADRMLAEQAVGRYSIDMVHGGASSISQRLMPNDAVIRIEQILFHPEVIDKSLWYGGKLWFRDPEDAFMLAHSARVIQGSGLDTVWFNTDLVSVEELEMWQGYRDVYEMFEVSMVDADPISSSGATDFFDPFRGAEYWEYIYGKDVFYTNDPRLIADSLAKGGFKIAWASSSARRELQSLRDVGAPVQNYGTVRLEQGWPAYESFPVLEPSGSGGSFAVAPNQPHPNATKLWVNWLLSREGMTTVNATLGEGETLPHDHISLRVDDIPVGQTDPAFRREPGVVDNTVFMNPGAAAMAQDLAQLRYKIYEQARGIANHPDIPELTKELEARRDAIEGLR